MKKILSLALLFIFAAPLFANNPVAEFKILEDAAVKQYQAGKFGSLFFYTKKKEDKVLFVARDLTSSFTYDLGGFPEDIRIFEDDNSFYITYWTAAKFKYTLNVLKANSTGVIKKARSSEYKEKLERVTFNGKDILLIEYKRGEYTAIPFSSEELKRKSEMSITLPDIGKESEWSLLGSSNGIMRFWGYILQDEESGVKEPMIYLCYVNDEGKLIKEQAIPIPIPKGKDYIPSHSIRSKNYADVGPLFKVIQSPFSDDIIVYTYTSNSSGSDMVWKRNGLQMFKIKLDLEDPALIFQKELKYIGGEEVGSYATPFVRILDEDFLMFLYKEKDGGLMSSKYFNVTVLLDNSGEILIHEKTQESKKGINAFIPDISDLNEFLKTSSKKNKTSITTTSKKIGAQDPDADLDLTKFGNQWMIIQHNKKAGTIKFYKV